MKTSTKATETKNLTAKYLIGGEERRAIFSTKMLLSYKSSDHFYYKSKNVKLQF